MNIFMFPKIAQKQSSMSFHWKHQENTLFYFDCYSEQKIKKGEVKNLAQAIY